MFSDSTQKKLGLTGAIATLSNSDQIQSIKSVGNQPRPASASPNTISLTRSRSLSTPAHVTEVRATTVRTAEMTSTVSVSFKRDPADYFFSKANVYVSGYKGNPKPTQVASGDSPISFSLENTGEPVSVTVQSHGNLGPAPLETAPNATLKLVKSDFISNNATAQTNQPRTTPPIGGSTSVASVAVPNLHQCVASRLGLSGQLAAGFQYFDGLVTINLAANLIEPPLVLSATTALGGDDTYFTDTGSNGSDSFSLRTLLSAGGRVKMPHVTAVNLTLTAAANASGGNTVYNGTITNGANGGLIGVYVTVAGFATGANNGEFRCVDSTATTLTLNNGGGVAETHAATGTSTAARCWIGVVQGGSATYPTKLNTDTPTVGFMGFRSSPVAGDTHWKLVTTDGSSQTVVDSGVAQDLAAGHVFQVIPTSSTSVDFYIDNIKVGTITSTLPSSAIMQPVYFIDNHGVAKTISMAVSSAYYITI